MNPLSSLPSEQAAIGGVINPQTATPATYTTGWVAAKDFHSYLAILAVGTMVATSTVDAKLQQATTSGGAGVKDVTGKAITQLTAAGTDSDKQVEINLRTEELDVEGGFDFVRLSVTVATANCPLAALLLGFAPRYAPASDADASTVDEIIK